MSEHPIEGLMLTAMNSIQDMVDVNTIIGEPIETNNNKFQKLDLDLQQEEVNLKVKLLMNILKKIKKNKYNIGYLLEVGQEQELVYLQLLFW